MSYRFIRTVIIGLCSVFLLGACGPMPLEPRERTSFNAGWLFSFNDDFLAAQPDFADSDWRKLDLPHDWAIEGDFSEDNPSGTGGGALPGGVGWYRKTFVPDMADKGKAFPDRVRWRIYEC